jgi:hypothetical protein
VTDPKKESPDEGTDEPGEEHLYENWDELASDPEQASRFGRAIEAILPDILRRGVEGIVAEDGIRAIVADRGLPREAVGLVMSQVDATKREILRVVSREMRMFLENVDLGGELTKILTSVSFEIRTEVRFIPNDAAVRPDVRNRVAVRTRPEEGAPEEEVYRTSEEDAVVSAEDRPRRRRRWPLGRGREPEAEDEPPEQDS